MRILDVVAAVLLVVGGLNWGLVGLFRFDLVAMLSGGLNFGDTNLFSRIIYTVVGSAAAYQALALRGIWDRWGVKGTTRHASMH